MEMIKRLKNLLTLPTRKKPAVGQTPVDEVYAENKWRLLRYRPAGATVTHPTPILLVPSLINRHYVLDLLPGKSFAEYLANQGFDTYCIDWGTPGDEDRFVTFEDVVDSWLGRAIRKVAATSPGNKTHVLGYCMGGTLAAIHGAVHQEHIASLVGLAAPVQFHDDSMLSRWTLSKGFDVDALVDGFGTVPWQLLQATFHMLRPTLTLQKVANVIDRAWNDEFLDGFLALETWGNDNVSLPGEFYRRYITDLYRRDALVAGKMTLGAKRVELKNIRFPVMAVSFANDNIVPAASAAALAQHVGSDVHEHVHLPGGHVGAVVSKHAAKSLWPQIAAFYARHDVKPLPAPAPVAVNLAAAPQPVAKSRPPARRGPHRRASAPETGRRTT